MAQLPDELLSEMAKAALEYHRREFDRDRWIDCLERWLRELSIPSSTSLLGRPGMEMGKTRNQLQALRAIESS